MAARPRDESPFNSEVYDQSGIIDIGRYRGSLGYRKLSNFECFQAGLRLVTSSPHLAKAHLTLGSERIIRM